MGLEHEGRVVLHLRVIPVTVPREGHGQARPIPVPEVTVVSTIRRLFECSPLLPVTNGIADGQQHLRDLFF